MAFVTTAEKWSVAPRTQALSDCYDLDVVIAHVAAVDDRAISDVFRLGARSNRKILWHDDFSLWLDQCEGVGRFVPLDPAGDTHFWVEDGRLHCDKRLPYRSVAERDQALFAADRMLRRLVQGR